MKYRKFGTEFQIDEGLVAENEEEIRSQLNEYFSGERKAFDLKISFPDSFTGDVMREMAKIPHGKTKTYGEIAEVLNSSAVAVGQACGRNKVPVVVPCHRVVGKNSSSGYIYGKEVKKKLLDMERERL